ncbi:MAG: TolC family protein [Candidatus Marinimicrobia bacterium]|nr:TolC family protein [Candidatus Neomarinimicrobiota bacterium]
MKHKIKILFLNLVLSGIVLSQVNVDPVKVLLSKNRDILAAEEAYKAALKNVKVYGVLPDPMVESTFFIKPIETRTGPMEGQFMLGQKFPLWGKLKRHRSVAKNKAEIARLNLEKKKIMTVFQMRQEWESYIKFKNSLGILNDYREELETFRSIALTQYSTGVGITQHPILKLQIEISLVESQINSLESNFESTVNTLQSLFDGTFSPDLFKDRRTSIIPSNDLKFWLGLAKESHPLYLKVQSEHQIAILQNELAVRKNYPDLITGLTYTIIGDGSSMTTSTGADAMGFKVGLNLPIWFGRNKARIESTKLTVSSKEETIKQTWNQIEDNIRSTKKDLDEIQETYSLYRYKLVQESEQMLSSAFSAYETGKINFLDLLDSERMVVKVRLSFEEVEANRRIASAKMVKNIGLIQLSEE